MTMKALVGIYIVALVSFVGALWSCNAMVDGLVAANQSESSYAGLAAYGVDLTVQPVWANSLSVINTPTDIQPALGVELVQ